MNQILHCGPSDLNHPKVKPLTMSFAQQLNWNPKFLEFVFADQRQACFDHTCEAPNDGWTCYIPDEFDVAYPLWSTNADQTLLLLSGTKLVYGKGWHDDADMEYISTSHQGLLAYLINVLYEHECSDQVLLDAIQSSGFDYYEKFLSFRADVDERGKDWEGTWKKFIASIDMLTRDSFQ